MTIIASYLDAVIERVEWVRDTQENNIRAAAQHCAEAIARDKLAFTFGTGHGGFAALETFPRTGTVTGFRPIVDTPIALMHHVWGDMGTHQYRLLHSREGYGQAILRAHRVTEGDAMVLFSHSGINAVILDIANECTDRHIPVIAVTSLPHSQQVPSRHSSGKRLFEIADVVVDTGVPIEDAAQRVHGLDDPLGPTSTSVAVACAHAIVSATAEELVARGRTPFIMVNTNTAGVQRAHEQNDRNYEELWRLLKNR